MNNMLSPNIDFVASCLKDGVDPNALIGGDADDVRALAVHSFLGRMGIVCFLLQNGADPNLGRESTGETPLHHAVFGNYEEAIKLEVVESLLKAGGDPNARCQNGVTSINFMRDVRVRSETPLHRAAAYAERPVIQALIDAGATLGMKDANGDSALSWASLHRREKEVLRLLCYGDHRI